MSLVAVSVAVAVVVAVDPVAIARAVLTRRCVILRPRGELTAATGNVPSEKSSAAGRPDATGDDRRANGSGGGGLRGLRADEEINTLIRWDVLGPAARTEPDRRRYMSEWERLVGRLAVLVVSSFELD